MKNIKRAEERRISSNPTNHSHHLVSVPSHREILKRINQKIRLLNKEIPAWKGHWCGTPMVELKLEIEMLKARREEILKEMKERKTEVPALVRVALLEKLIDEARSRRPYENPVDVTSHRLSDEEIRWLTEQGLRLNLNELFRLILTYPLELKAKDLREWVERIKREKEKSKT